MNKKGFLKIVLLSVLLVTIFGLVSYYLYNQTDSQLPKTDEKLVENIVLGYIKAGNITPEVPVVEVRGSTYEGLKITTYSADVYFKSAEQPKIGLALDYYSVDINADTEAVVRFEKRPTCALDKITTKDQAIEAVKNETGKSGTQSYLMNAAGSGCTWYVFVGEDGYSYRVKGDGAVYLQTTPIPAN